MKKKKILVIDDFEPIRDEIVDFLDMENFKTFSAKNGAEGVQMAVTQQPDLIICDVQMPIMDGYQVYKTLENIPTTATIPFVFLTALTQVEDIRKGLLLGADDYLIKPFKLDSLLLTLKKRLEKYERYASKSENKFEAILNNPLIGTFVFKEKELTAINQKFTDITSFTKNEINKLDPNKILIGKKEEIINDFIFCLQGTHETFRKEISFINKNKKTVFAEIFGKHTLLGYENAVVGTIKNINLEIAQPMAGNELDKVTTFLKKEGKEEIAQEIENTKKQIAFENHQEQSTNNANLSKREEEVLTLICQGYTNSEISRKLFLSPRTIDNHRARILSKTESKNTANLVAFAIKNNYFKI